MRVNKDHGGDQQHKTRAEGRSELTSDWRPTHLECPGDSELVDATGSVRWAALMSARLSEEDQFNLEVLKLLLAVAWVDGQVDQHEVNVVLGLGRSWTVPEAALQALHRAIREGKRPAEPDWALLKTRPDDALQAARALMLADGKATNEEIALLRRLKERLAA